MKKLYLDIDNVCVYTEVYLRKMITPYGFKSKDFAGSFVGKVLSDLSYLDIYDNLLSDYSIIPKVEGFLDTLNLLSTEYNVILLGLYRTETEKQAKEKFAQSLNKSILLSHHDELMELDGILVSSNVDWLAYQQESIYFYSKFNTSNPCKKKVVFTWFELLDYLLGEVEEDEELRKYICSRVPTISERSRV